MLAGGRSMLSPRPLGALTLAAILMSACAPTTRMPGVSSAEAAREAEFQKRLVLEQHVADAKRVVDVGTPILAGAADMCGDKVAPKHGYLAVTAADFDDETRGAARAAFGVGRLPKVLSVTKDSPAARAGLQAGDVIKAVNGALLPTSADPGKTLPDAGKALARLRAAAGYAPVTYTVIQPAPTSMELPIVVTPARLCDYRLLLDKSEAVNAFADGKSIHVTSGMLRFASSDTELSGVLSHELAHNLMGHVDAKQANATSARRSAWSSTSWPRAWAPIPAAGSPGWAARPAAARSPSPSRRRPITWGFT